MFGLDQTGGTDALSLRRSDQPPEFGPVVNAAERLLLCLFLRRYVTWCARHRRFAACKARRNSIASSALEPDVCSALMSDSSLTRPTADLDP